jgi:hypothetical protein
MQSDWFAIVDMSGRQEPISRFTGRLREAPEECGPNDESSVSFEPTTRLSTHQSPRKEEGRRAKCGSDHRPIH